MLARNENNYGRELTTFNSLMDLFMREMGAAHHPFFNGESNHDSLQLKVDEKEVTAILPCAGCRGSDFEVETSGDILTVKVKHSSTCEKEGKKKNYIARERCFREFTESIHLPVPVKGQEATAKYEDGILTISLPRMGKDEEKNRRIEVK